MNDREKCPECGHPWFDHDQRGCGVDSFLDGPCPCSLQGPMDFHAQVSDVAAATASELRVQRLREQLAAVGQYVSDLRTPIAEGYRKAPASVSEGLSVIYADIDRLDRELAKIGQRRAVGGAVKLEEVWVSGEGGEEG